jgi:transposase-like protein
MPGRRFLSSSTRELYYRFNLSHRNIEDLLAERGVIVSREAIRLWCIKFGALSARRLKRKHRGYGDTFYIDEVFVKINGKQLYLWRAVDQDGEVVAKRMVKKQQMQWSQLGAHSLLQTRTAVLNGDLRDQFEN